MKSKGFTLIELILVLALLTAAAGVIAPLFQRFQIRSDMETTVVTVAHSLRRAQSLSQSMEGDATWGVYIDNGQVVIFQGDDHATRSTDFDEVYNMPNQIRSDGQYEIVFSKLEGLPSFTGTITLISNSDETKIININSQGTVSY